MRITDGMQYAAAIRALGANAEVLEGATRKAASGIDVASPSDDPVRYSAGVALSSRLAALEGRRKAVARGAGDLELTEAALADATDILVRARELAVATADGGASTQARLAAAKEVALLRQALGASANAHGTRGYLFAGTATGTAPFDASGDFAGNDGLVQVEISEGVQLVTNIGGAAAFGGDPAGRDLFADLESLETALLADDPGAVRAHFDLLDQGREQLTVSRAEAGRRIERLQSAGDVIDTLTTGSRAALAEQTEGEANAVLARFTQAQAAYERSLAVTRQILSSSGTSSRF